MGEGPTDWHRTQRNQVIGISIGRLLHHPSRLVVQIVNHDKGHIIVGSLTSGRTLLAATT